jgi:hypothetical protein
LIRISQMMIIRRDMTIDILLLFPQMRATLAARHRHQHDKKMNYGSAEFL